MIDLDNFKYYNDTQGHSAGDDLIVRIGQALKNRLREIDVLARLGGDEFAVLLSQAGRRGAPKQSPRHCSRSSATKRPHRSTGRSAG